MELYIPSELGYGDRGSPPKIGGGDALIFKMEILEVNGETTPAIRCDALTGEGCDDKETAYISKAKTKFPSAEAISAELARLGAIDKVAPDLQAWATRRKNILQQMLTAMQDLTQNEL